MADNKNMALNDEAMAKAAGGTGEGQPTPKFNVGDKVVYVNDNSNLVVESKKYMEGPVTSEWIYVARDPENSNHFVSGPDMLFRLA